MDRCDRVVSRGDRHSGGAKNKLEVDIPYDAQDGAVHHQGDLITH